ncbi:MAG TPA: amino acid permease [Actinomycetota bacterium]
MALLRTKSVEESIRDTEEPEHKLRKALGPIDLIVFGIGVVIGTGIFVLTGIAAATKAGPAVPLSFVAAGVACALAALCYAEFASTVPVAGSAYTFSYASIGELIAWIIGWDLLLELALGAAAVAKGWSGYFATLFEDAGVKLPTSVVGEKATVNLPALGIVLLITGIIIVGVRLSSRVNTVIVAVKLAVVVFVIGLGATAIKAANWHPFIPPPSAPIKAANASGGGTPLIQLLTGSEPHAFGAGGIMLGAALVFFAFIGFDVVATTAEEARRPQRDLPLGIIGSLAICTVLYVAVSAVVTGMVSYKRLNVEAPLAFAFQATGRSWAATIVSVGAIAGLTTVILTLLLGQSRVLFAMSRDRLLPPGLARVHPRFGTPYRISLIVGIVVAVVTAFVPLTTLADLVNIGTLFAFVLVSIGVIVLRRTRPDLPRAFRTPLVPLVPILAVIACVYLMLNLVDLTWIRFAIWMAAGLVVYFLYSRSHSRLAAPRVGAGRERNIGGGETA